MITVEYCLYVVQLLPILDPGRIKIGRSKRLEERLCSYQLIAPEAQFIAAWWGPTTRRNEITAIELVNGIYGVQRLGAELFNVRDIDQVIEVLTGHFGPQTSGLISPILIRQK